MATLAQRAAAVDRISKALVDFEPDTQVVAYQGLQGATDPGKAAAAIEAAATSVKDSSPIVQRAAIAAASGFGQPDAATTNDLWRYIVLGLLALLGVALIGLLALLGLSKDGSLALTAFTAILTGTVGLFVPSPAGSSGGGK
jgi:hypothetical protein